MSLIRDHARYYKAPPSLERKILQSIRREKPRDWRWYAIAATVLLTASLAANIALLTSRPSSQQVLADNVVAAHIRSLAGEHLLDVPSSDHHTVKPWFNGRLDFSPDVREIEGFVLAGGRIEYFEGRPAAALVYMRRKHVVNLFTWPSSRPATAFDETQNGYHVRAWSEAQMTYWAVSDLNESELNQFVAAYKK
jgi:anti-sigma factor RsiW